MTPQDLRDLILRGIDDVFTSWIAMRHISDGQKKLLRAERVFWGGADDATLQKLLDLYNKE